MMRLCFVGSYTASALERDGNGGMEGQIASLAQTMALRGHEVHLVDPADDGYARIYEGVHIVPAYDSNFGLRGIRFLHYRLPRFMKVLKSISADVYYTRGMTSFLLPTVLQTKFTRKVSVLALASDPELELGPSRHERTVDMNLYDRLWLSYLNPVFARIAVQQADVLLAQHNGQKDAVAGLNRKVEVVPNIFLAPSPEESFEENKNPGLNGYCLWIGNISKWKGAEELSTLAGMLPHIPIIVVGPVNHRKFLPYLSAIENRPNIQYRGLLPKREAMRLISAAKMLLNTSHFEGFPNVFLEAWWYRKPVISLSVNPGGVIKENGLGICADGSIHKMADAIRMLLCDSAARERMGEAGRRYVEENHLADKVSQQFERIVCKLKYGCL